MAPTSLLLRSRAAVARVTNVGSIVKWFWLSRDDLGGGKCGLEVEVEVGVG
jgi:hypothetical protein